MIGVNDLVDAIGNKIGRTLAGELIADYMKMRQDASANVLERASPGKFVETFVQCLQQMATGAHDRVPSVDSYLDRGVLNEATLPDGLKIVGARIARSIYTVRNKRNVAHKGELDPNLIDLHYAVNAATWIVCELVRACGSISMDEAARLVTRLQVPLGTLVEELEGTRLVHADVSIEEEVLILLHSVYPDAWPLWRIKESLSRRHAGSVANRVRELVASKTLHGDTKVGVRLTSAGFRRATVLVAEQASAEAA